MLGRKRTGSVLCTSCGVLVGVNDEKCYNCGRRNPALWGFAPVLRALGNDLGFVPFVFGLCTVMYVLTLFAYRSDGDLAGGSIFNWLGPTNAALYVFGASGAGIFFDRWWSVLSAGWLHGNILHFLINMYSLRTLAPWVAELYGPGRMVIIYTVSSAAGFTTSSLAAAYMPLMLGGSRFPEVHITIGASASLAGLLGAMFYYGKRGGSSVVSTQASQWILSMFVYGFIIPRIDNYAHLGGLAGGYLAARWLDPLKQERGDHILVAVLCLGASVVAIVYSAITGIIELRSLMR